MLSTALFWSAAGVVCFVYVGHPLLLPILRFILGRPIRKRPIQPTVSLLIAAHNEANLIEAKIRNALALDYPADRLEIAIASDGSSDDTVEIVSRFTDAHRVRLFAYPEHRGKLAVLNDSVPRLRGEIVAFSDASSRLASDAVRRLVESFADSSVGAVSGAYRVTNLEQAALGVPENVYWHYETFIKRQQAALGSIVVAHGAFYAVRKELYPFPAATNINDDLVIPLRIIQQGYRVAYEPEAVAFEEARHTSGFTQRIRIMTGNVQQLRELKGLLRPPRPLPLFFFLSHKVGRLVVPFALVALAVSNMPLKGPLYRWTLSAQLLFYGLALLGATGRLRPRLLRVPYHFCMVQVAALAGIYRALRGGRDIAGKQA